MENRQEMKPQRWTLEPALFLLFFGWYLSTTIVTNQILKQTCLVTFGYDIDICTQLDNKTLSHEVEAEIQPYVANILMTLNVLSSIVTTVLSLFLGPWSDKYGRKKVLNSIFIGITMSKGWIMIVSYLSDYYEPNDPWNYLIAHIPLLVTGGWPTLIIVMLCYMTDLSDESNRSIRFTIVEIIIFCGVVLATGSSSFLLKLTNPTTVFGVSFVCIFAGTMIVILFVDDSIGSKNAVVLSTQLKDLFSPVRVKELYEACIQKRPFKHRRILWLLTIILVANSFTTSGVNTVFYLFTRHKFGWTLQDLTLYEAATMLLAIVGSAFGLAVLKKVLNFSDLMLGFISLVSVALDAIIKAFAIQSWQLYVASAFGLFKFVASATLRSIMSTIVSREEIGKVYSITTAVEAVSGLGAAPLYTATYSATIATFPSAFNLITVAIFMCNLVLVFLVARWMMSSSGESKTETTKL